MEKSGDPGREEVEKYIREVLGVAPEAVDLAVSSERGKLGYKSVLFEGLLTGSGPRYTKSVEALREILFPKEETVNVRIPIHLTGFDPEKVVSTH